MARCNCNFACDPPGAETITVLAPPTILDPDSGEVSQVIDERAITDWPLNGRRYTDLALLSPGVTQDPSGLTSGSNGDLFYGGHAATRTATWWTAPATTTAYTRRHAGAIERRTSSAPK